MDVERKVEHAFLGEDDEGIIFGDVVTLTRGELIAVAELPDGSLRMATPNAQKLLRELLTRELDAMSA